MMKRFLKFFFSFLIAVLFLWLALRDISFYELRLTMSKLTYYWLLPYLFVSLLGHYLRAERWKQLIEQEGVTTSRMNLFSGVMLGYMVNYAVPRLGEVSRSVFVGNKEQLSRTKLIGTVVLERALDVLVLLILVFFVVIYLFSDYTLIISILGAEAMNRMSILWNFDNVMFFGLVLVFCLIALFLMVKIVWYISRRLPSLSNLMQILTETAKKFAFGLLSIKDIKNWPLFISLTIGIWVCYVLMTYIPFAAFNLNTIYGLGLQEAVVITAVSALGVSLPSPGGIGTYHWFVSRTMLLLFAVPETLGVAYAIVTHLVMMIIILAVTPMLLVLNKASWKRLKTKQAKKRAPGF